MDRKYDNKEIEHKEGDQMYIPSAMYISRGSEDRVGGLATIKKIDVDKNLGSEHPNGVFVTFEEFPNSSFNYKYLLEQQEELKSKFGDKKAYPDPDVDTPWIQPGDIVNGQTYNGPDIW